MHQSSAFPRSSLSHALTRAADPCARPLRSKHFIVKPCKPNVVKKALDPLVPGSGGVVSSGGHFVGPAARPHPRPHVVSSLPRRGSSAPSSCASVSLTPQPVESRVKLAVARPTPSARARTSFDYQALSMGISSVACGVNVLGAVDLEKRAQRLLALYIKREQRLSQDVQLPAATSVPSEQLAPVRQPKLCSKQLPDFPSKPRARPTPVIHAHGESVSGSLQVRSVPPTARQVPPKATAWSRPGQLPCRLPCTYRLRCRPPPLPENDGLVG